MPCPYNEGILVCQGLVTDFDRQKPLGLFFGQLRGLDFKPSFLQMMLFVQEYDVYPASPLPAVVRGLSFLLAPTARRLEGLVMRAVFFRRLRHQTENRSV